MRLIATLVVTAMAAIALGGCAEAEGDPRGENYCAENQYARDCPLEDKSGRADEDAMQEGFNDVEKQGPADGGGSDAPHDDPNTLPDESNGPTECDVDYDPDYCGSYHGP